jgi:hypothetical protein
VLENLQESLDEMVRRDASGDYSGVVEDARGLMKELESAEQLVQQLRKDTSVATAQAVARWNQSSSKTGALLEQLSAGIGQRARAPGTPADLEALATARATLADLRSQWLQAESKFASGEASGAVQLADDIQRRAREVLNDLGFTQASVAGTAPVGR